MKWLILGVAVTGLVSGLGCNRQDAGKFPADLEVSISLLEPGNPPATYSLQPGKKKDVYLLTADRELPVEVTATAGKPSDDIRHITFTVRAAEDVKFSLSGALTVEQTTWEDGYFLLPGFWYRKNLRSPDNAPSARISKDWMVRDDRMSVPLTGVYNTGTGASVTLCRNDEISGDVLAPYEKGDVVLYGDADIGSMGFGESLTGSALLSFTYPYAEFPRTYIRKLTLDPPVQSFLHLDAGDSRTVSFEIREWNSGSYSAFVEEVWNHAYDVFMPELVPEKRTDEEIKSVLAEYFRQSYTDDFPVKGFSGVHLRTDLCEQRGILEVGFVGRVLLNAYNALEYGYDTGDDVLIQMAWDIFDSYSSDGFTEGGFLREVIDYREGHETEIYSIRRQSEGLFALLQFLELEQKHERTHPELEGQVRTLLDKVVALQQGNRFPRKFRDNMQVTDNAGGSSSTAVVPLLMGWKYFGDETYLAAARNTAVYLEKEIVSKGDYFSSTLDANCEDKEASIYTASALYYLGLTADDQETAEKYYGMAETASYFALSWYYLWDVPFAPGQLHGELGLKTRGWGNVSVENNHIDVYIFDFADVLRHLAKLNGNKRLAEMAEVIRSSMREQLLPVEGRMCGIAKTGYYPEVVQHTHWDYGQFGKGFYNNIFAPGWTVASLWELLSDNRLHNYFKD